MIKEKSKIYETPLAKVIEVESEGIVCASGKADKNGYTYQGSENW